jgi:hypothetical protein
VFSALCKELGMPPVRRFCAISVAVTAIAGLALLASCDGQPSGPQVDGILLARGGGGPPPKVDEADPPSAPQDTTLDVRVLGSGFDNGSMVEYTIDGAPQAQVRTNSVTFVSENELITDVTIDLDAQVDLYDVEVTNFRGKKGIGADKFSVFQKGGPPPGPIPLDVTFRDTAGDGVLSDGGGIYIDGVNDVEAILFEIGNFRLDARMVTVRQICFDFAGQPGAPSVTCDDGYITTADPDIEGGLRAMAVGTTMTTRSQTTWVKDGFNWFLRFGRDCEATTEAANRVSVTHPDSDTWTIEGTNATLCKMSVKGRPRGGFVGQFSMPFRLTLRRL